MGWNGESSWEFVQQRVIGLSFGVFDWGQYDYFLVLLIYFVLDFDANVGTLVSDEYFDIPCVLLE